MSNINFRGLFDDTCYLHVFNHVKNSDLIDSLKAKDSWLRYELIKSVISSIQLVNYEAFRMTYNTRVYTSIVATENKVTHFRLCAK